MGGGGGGHTIGHFLLVSDTIGACMKGLYHTRFIFNNQSSFVNSLLVRSYVLMVFTYVKVATVKLPRELLPSDTENLDD